MQFQKCCRVRKDAIQHLVLQQERASQQKVLNLRTKNTGRAQKHLGISSLHWHTQMLLIDVPAGSKLHSPLLDLIFIGSPGVLHPDVGTFQLNGKGVHTGRMANNACLF